MSSCHKVLVSIYDNKGNYSPILAYDTMECAKRDFDAQLRRFPEEDRDDFRLCYYGFFDCDEGRLIVPSHDGTYQYAIYDSARTSFDYSLNFSITPITVSVDGVEQECLTPTLPTDIGDLVVFAHNSKDEEDDKPW